MFTKIVVPLDGSREGTIAVPYACLVARLAGASVTLLRAVSNARDVAEAQAFLHGVASEHATPGVTIDAVVRDGDAPDVIVSEVRQRGADLVVMRTRGRSGLARAVLGSVAEKIVRESPTPVLLLPPRERGDAPDSIGSILVPVDGSPGGALALGIAHTGATRAFLGSVTDAVVRAARCPVLVIRRDAEAEVQPVEAATASPA